MTRTAPAFHPLRGENPRAAPRTRSGRRRARAYLSLAKDDPELPRDVRGRDARLAAAGHQFRPAPHRKEERVPAQRREPHVHPRLLHARRARAAGAQRAPRGLSEVTRTLQATGRIGFLGAGGAPRRPAL